MKNNISKPKKPKETQNVKAFKVKHGIISPDFLNMFDKAYQVALFAKEQKQLKNKWPTSKQVKDIGLPSTIACQIIKKYFNNKKLKTINENNIKLVIASQNLILNKQKKNIKIKIKVLNQTINCWFDITGIIKINQIELDKTYAYIVCSYEKPILKPIVKDNKYIGIDLNSTSHSIVIANQKTGKIKKYGKSIPHIQRKYKNIRRKLQSKSKIHAKLGSRNHNIVNDKLYKITNAIIAEAKSTNCGIKLENLKGIRQNCTVKTYNYKKTSKVNSKNSKLKNKRIIKENKLTKIHNKRVTRTRENNHTLNSWPFFNFKLILKHKAIMSGIRIIEVDPYMTSQTCSRCGEIGDRNRKSFKCNNINCMHIDHSDVNAAFEIAQRSELIDPVVNENNRRGDKAVTMQLPLTPSSGIVDMQSKVSQSTEPQVL